MDMDVIEARALQDTAAPAPPWAGIALADLFAASVQAQPQGAAFRQLDEGATTPRTVTFAAAERAVQRCTDQFGDLGLRSGQVLVISMVATAEAPVVLLAALRAGLTPCLASPALPMEAMTELAGRPDVGAVVTLGVAGALRPAERWRTAAAVAGGGRFVLAFGDRLPGGVLRLDGVSASSADAGFAPVLDREASAAPILTAVLVDGRLAIARHEQDGVVAAGLLSVMRCGMASAAAIVTTLAPVTHAGLVTGIIPALLTGGTLWQVPMFGADALLAGADALERPHIVVPAALEDAAIRGGLLARAASVTLLHRAPAQFSAQPAAAHDLSTQAIMVDALACGEHGLLMARRDASGAMALAPGEARVPDADGGLVVRAETGPGGRLYLAGTAVPTRIETAEGTVGVAETGLVCRLDGRGRMTLVTTP